VYITFTATIDIETAEHTSFARTINNTTYLEHWQLTNHASLPLIFLCQTVKETR